MKDDGSLVDLGMICHSLSKEMPFSPQTHKECRTLLCDGEFGWVTPFVTGRMIPKSLGNEIISLLQHILINIRIELKVLVLWQNMIFIAHNRFEPVLWDDINGNGARTDVVVQADDVSCLL